MAFDTNGAIITYKLDIETPHNLLANQIFRHLKMKTVIGNIVKSYRKGNLGIKNVGTPVENKSKLYKVTFSKKKCQN